MMTSHAWSAIFSGSEMKVGELFEVITIADAIVTKCVAEIPDFLDGGRGVHRLAFHCSRHQISIK